VHSRNIKHYRLGKEGCSLFPSKPVSNRNSERKTETFAPLLPQEVHGHKLIQDVVTRWNSKLDMLERLIEQAPALHAAFMEPSVKKAIDITMLLSFEEQEID